MADRTPPFKSKIIPYVSQIKAWRRSGKTWKEVTEELKKLGLSADPGNVCRVIGRIKRRPYPRGAEPEQDPPKIATIDAILPPEPTTDPFSATPESQVPHLNPFSKSQGKYQK